MLPWWETRAKRIYTFSLSPYRQKAFAKFFSVEFRNMLNRNFGSFALFGISACVGYYVTVWADKKYALLHRKNPKDYEKYYTESVELNE